MRAPAFEIPSRPWGPSCIRGGVLGFRVPLGLGFLEFERLEIHEGGFQG